MRKLMSICIAALLAVFIVGKWITAQTVKAAGQSPVMSATMNPFEMMMNSKNLPVQNVVDPL